MRGRYIGHIIPYDECAICGKSLCEPGLGPSERVITKRKTEVRFHKKCYKELCIKQRSSNANT